MAEEVVNLASVLGEREACKLLGFSRATFRRHHEHVPIQADTIAASPRSSRQQRRYEMRQATRHDRREQRARRPSSLALRPKEVQTALDAIHQERFVDRSVPYIYATLLDEGVYHCSTSTMYRILHRVHEVGERRDQATRPAYIKPELCATAPGQVWAWDITKLHGPRKWTYYYLYAVIDIYSRYIVGWMLADRESSELARALLSETIVKEGVDPKTLTIHADNGSSMASKPLAFMLADLGVTKSHSRPHVSNDNPHIESWNKTLKYQPQFPETFANITQARAFVRDFVDWYNFSHRHSALELLSPSDVHHGRATEQLQKRHDVMQAAYCAHPERFVNGKPRLRKLASASYINRPTEVEDGNGNVRDHQVAIDTIRHDPSVPTAA